MSNILPIDYEDATLVGRVHRPGLGASVITIRDSDVLDITSSANSLSNLLDCPDPLELSKMAKGESIGPLDTIVTTSIEPKIQNENIFLLAPCDLQPIKACGVTFAKSLMERIIEESAEGDRNKAEIIRKEIIKAVGSDLKQIKPGSKRAQAAKKEFQRLGLWSQYLEVGIGPDAEIFTKAPPMASVGFGEEIGLHPASKWNNSEPEIVLAVNSRGKAVGATLGNDLNLRDVEGRSALLLGKAKDNNASSAIGPFVRLFDKTFTLEDIRNAEVHLKVEGRDDFILNDMSSMREISRDPLELIDHTFGDHHQYPDGFMLFLGTLFAPTEDREGPGSGFTHKLADKVTIHSDRIGTLINYVTLSTLARPWTYGVRSLIHDLAARKDCRLGV